ncbi:hypothetical protein EDC01DRAFT_634169 [Geopyxis carbonaria]|nr:hypothetical protein EDC01DRAFT_634169 [Geopyxis carbonaria]
MPPRIFTYSDSIRLSMHKPNSPHPQREARYYFNDTASGSGMPTSVPTGELGIVAPPLPSAETASDHVSTWKPTQESQEMTWIAAPIVASLVGVCLLVSVGVAWTQRPSQRRLTSADDGIELATYQPFREPHRALLSMRTKMNTWGTKMGSFLGRDGGVVLGDNAVEPVMPEPITQVNPNITAPVPAEGTPVVPAVRPRASTTPEASRNTRH